MARTGIRPSAPEAVKALCCGCCANYADGRYVDCEVRDCPIYCKMPYRSKLPDFMWLFGKWRKSYEQQRRALGLTQEEYINQFIIKGKNKFNIGYTAMFRAKCFRCMGNFYDGRADCDIPSCPIYYWMPYREKDPDLNWLFDLPYTRKHRDRCKFDKISREEYIAKYIAKGDVEIEEPEDKDEKIVKVRKVRTLA